MNCVKRNIEVKAEEYRRQCVIAVGEQDADDLFHDVCIQILSDEKYEQLCHDGKLTYYVMGCIHISSYSTSCPFYVKYRKMAAKRVEIPDPMLKARNQEYVDLPRDTRPLQLRDLIEEYQEENWFEATMLEVYYFHNHSYKTLSDATGICKSTVRSVIRRAKENLKTFYEEKTARARRRRGEGDGGHGDQGSGGSVDGRLRMQGAEGSVE